jgi:hypothetical protein
MKGHPKVILLGLEIVQDEDKFTGKKEDVKYIKVSRRNEKTKEEVNKEQVQRSQYCSSARNKIRVGE